MPLESSRVAAFLKTMTALIIFEIIYLDDLFSKQLIILDFLLKTEIIYNFCKIPSLIFVDHASKDDGKIEVGISKSGKLKVKGIGRFARAAPGPASKRTIGTLANAPLEHPDWNSVQLSSWTQLLNQCNSHQGNQYFAQNFMKSKVRLVRQ